MPARETHLAQTISGMLDSQQKLQLLYGLRRSCGGHWQWRAAVESQLEAMTCWRRCTALYPAANDPAFPPPEAA